ncbi:MAG TPA: TRAP transporter large permease [Thermoanaerobacterales bacterium]|uniref:TRAP transporter large permease n=1 Tax=Tepidanaerobacter sp. GT38 TaxID=2722793 RepID=UPI0018430056|nr:TRAP transporter large permease [Tepidanaerobacter sp. GT38]HHY43075.1 TRAP transporter large permease [Thermoanaerobacterales bacterium]
MMAAILFLSFVVLIFLGVPIAFSLGISSLIYILLNDISLTVIAQKMYAGIDSFVLVAIPGFVLAGNLMNHGGMSERLVKFGDAIIGFVRGGLALANVVISMIFAGISGTALADTASEGPIIIPAMVRQGYDPDFAAAITAASSTVGPIIPPSTPMIITGTIVGLSVTKLFVAGIVPGILIGIFQMILCYYLAVKRNYPKGELKPIKYIWDIFKESVWALLLTAFILFGILGGVFTPTEASIVSVLYGLIVGMFVYKEIKIKDIPGIVMESLKSTASIMVLVGFANTFAWILASEQIPQLIAETILSISTNPIVVILLVNALLLFVGMFMETIAAIVILFPVLFPVLQSIGMDPIQAGVMMVLNLIIGVTTPPVGVCLFVAANIANISLVRISKAIFPFIVANIIVLLLVSFVPALTVYLPNLLLGH